MTLATYPISLEEYFSKYGFGDGATSGNGVDHIEVALQELNKVLLPELVAIPRISGGSHNTTRIEIVKNELPLTLEDDFVALDDYAYKLSNSGVDYVAIDSLDHEFGDIKANDYEYGWVAEQLEKMGVSITVGEFYVALLKAACCFDEVVSKATLKTIAEYCMNKE